MSVAGQLIQARDEIANRGRCRSDLINEHGQVCLLGAVGVAVGGWDFIISPNYDLFEEDPRAKAVVAELVKHMPQEHVHLSNESYENLYEYNDLNSIPDEDVLNLFDKALADLGGLG